MPIYQTLINYGLRGPSQFHYFTMLLITVITVLSTRQQYHTAELLIGDNES